MTIIEQAYRILDLKAGATIKDIVESRENLLVLWDPNRLGQYPHLKSKATLKTKEIHWAYKTLMQNRQHGGTASETLQPPPTATASMTHEKVFRTSSASQKTSTSLFDEVFSDKESRKDRQISTGLTIGGLLVAFIILGVVLQIINEEPTDPKSTAEPLAQTNSLQVPSTLKSSHIEDKARIHANSENRSLGKLKFKLPTVVTSNKPTTTKPSNHTRPTSPAASIVSDNLTPRIPSKPNQKNTSKVAKKRPILMREEPPKIAKQTIEQKVLDEEIQRLEAEENKRQFEEAEKAYKILLVNSEEANRVVGGELPGIRFTDWKVILVRGSEIWLDLSAEQFGDQPVHFIWNVDIKEEKVQALSQAARDLESQTR